MTCRCGWTGTAAVADGEANCADCGALCARVEVFRHGSDAVTRA